jgi:hypothetical protein
LNERPKAARKQSGNRLEKKTGEKMKGHPFTKYSGAWKDLLSLHQLFNY